MNLLFLTSVEVSPFGSGIQRITHVLSQAFQNHGIDCYSTYYINNEDEFKTFFVAKLKLERGNEYEPMKNFITDNKIQFIICQGVNTGLCAFENIRRAADSAGNCKLVYCLHTTPAQFDVKPNNSAEFFRIIHKIQVARSIKKLAAGLLPRAVFNFLAVIPIRKEFFVYNDFFDKIILLSKNYIDDYGKISKITANNKNKIVAIPNSLVFDAEILEDEIYKKQNEILIVTRLSDRQKRISTALKIWKNVQQKTDIEDWKLTIIGTGEDELYYKHLAKKHQIKAVNFEGKQNPIEYYRRASIFMMTSAHEGFPMTLLEAQQMGVVPIAFDSFGAVSDIIENEKNGLLVGKNNNNQYAKKLIWLMQNIEQRRKMAKFATDTCQIFTLENVIRQWVDLFNSKFL